jgi:Domain of unknown function (DUF4350)
LFTQRPLLKWVALLWGALFVVGMTRLFWLRFEAGDLYPPYSSLRSDPLGVQALYESLGEVGEVSRNFRPLGQVALDPASTFLVCGLTARRAALWGDRWKPFLDAVAAGGGRLVVAFIPGVNRNRGGWEKSEPPPEEKDDTAKGAPVAKGKDDPGKASGLWGLGLRVERGDGGKKDGEAERCDREGPALLPATLIRHSPLFFELLDSCWEPVYSDGDQVVVARRPWGKGEVVVVADSYPFSNEALRFNRSSGFLGWALRPGGPVVFDEFHHGLSKQPGLAALMRKYRLQGLMASLAVLVLLGIWRQSVVFVPQARDPVPTESEIALGRAASDGWISLLQGHIPTGELLSVCHEAWRSSVAADRVPREKTDRVAELVSQYKADPRHRHPDAVYRDICQTLKQDSSS